MRGVAFIGGEGPVPALASALVGTPDVVVAADSGLTAAENAGFRPDWIVGDMDSLIDLSRLAAYPPDRVLRYPRDKDDTDTELALRLLWEQGCGQVELVGGGGGRMDHLLALAALFDREKAPDRWISSREDVRLVRDTVQARIPQESLVSVFPVGKGPWKAESTGLRWPLDALAWDRGFYGVSNVAVTGDIRIRALAGRFLLILPLGS